MGVKTFISYTVLPQCFHNSVQLSQCRKDSPLLANEGYEAAHLNPLSSTQSGFCIELLSEDSSAGVGIRIYHIDINTGRT